MSFALDLTNGNLYFTGMNFTTGIIGVISSSGDVTVIFDQGNDVFDIVLHPENGYFFCCSIFSMDNDLYNQYA